MLALKLLLVPGFLAAISWAGRRWGATAAGWLAGLPVVAGPILVFLALERGAEFAAQAAIAALSGVFASLAFNVAYSRMALRRRWPAALATGMATWTGAAALVALLPPSPWLALGAALAGLIAAPWALPAPRLEVPAKPLPSIELVLRMVAALVLTFVVTMMAERLGATWSGLLTVFPLLGSVLAVFSHVSNGVPFVITLFHAMARSFYGFATFCFTLALALLPLGLPPAVLIALACALAVQGAAFTLVKARARG